MVPSWVPQPNTFDARVADWVAYVESAPGKLRHLETLHHLREHLPPRPLNLLDLGAGAGELAAALARQGHTVTVVDYSAAMLDEAKTRCAGLAVNCICADATRVETVFDANSFDAVLCHSLLEFVESPENIIAQLAVLLRPGGLLSLLVGNRHHAPLRKALLGQDFDSARRELLEEEVPATDLFGLPRRTFYPEAAHQMVEKSGFRVVGEYGVRVFADLLSETPDDLNQLLDLETVAGGRMPYRYMARFVQIIALKE